MKTIKGIAVPCSLCNHGREIYLERDRYSADRLYRVGCLCPTCLDMWEKDDARTQWATSITEALVEWAWMNYGDSEEPPPDWRCHTIGGKLRNL